MVQVQDLIQSVLKSREFGIYPHSILDQEKNNVELLFRALNIEHHITVYVQANKDEPEVLNDFLKELERLSFGPKDSIAQLTVNVALGYLYHINTEYEKVIQHLSQIKLVEGTTYLKALYYKTYWIISSSYEKLGRLEDAKNAVLAGVNLFKDLPLVSQLEISYWLHQLFDKLDQYVIPSVITAGEVDKIFKNKNFVLYYINYIKKPVNGTESFIKARAGSLLSSLTFPKSNEENNHELEEFLEVLTDSNFNNLISLNTLADLLEQGISKTYQSQKILRSYIKVLFKSNNRLIELESSLEVFITYVENYHHLNNKHYYDFLAVLDLFHIVMSKGLRLNKFKYFLDKFKSILLEFYTSNSIDPIHDPRVNSFRNPELRLKFSKYWYSIAVNELGLIRSSNLIEKESLDYTSVTNAFDNSIILDPSNEEFVFDYILHLSSIRKVKNAYKLLKDSLKRLTPGTLTYFRSLHLFALILSIEDNKNEAFKISSFLSSEIEEYLSVRIPTDLDFKVKERLIEIKITHLSIIESLFGVEQALDSLSDLFVLFHNLFSDIIVKNGEDEDELLSDDVKPEEKAVKAHRKSLSLAKQQTLTKIKSIAHKKQPKAIKTQTTTFKIPKDHVMECKLLQKIWLVSSQVYFKMKLYKESEESLIEAENSYKSTDETYFQLACLLIQSTRCGLAVDEFEKGLSLNKSSIPCIVGLSNLILNHSTEPQDKNSIFINEKDQLAALARVKLLLEEISKTFKGYYTSEVWLLSSQIYEKFGDSKRLQGSLWRSIELEESRPLRDFSCV